MKNNLYIKIKISALCRIFYTCALGALLVFFSACSLDVNPEDAISSGTIANTSDGLNNVMNGNYALMKDRLVFNGTIDDNNGFLRQYYQMSDFAGDDIVCGQKTEDPFYYSFTGTHSPDQTNARFYWYLSYKIINGCNTTIQIGESLESVDEDDRQLIGEAYFLRAFMHFNLARLYATPYSHDPSKPGIILRLSTNDPSEKGRATVGETYQQVLDDLLTAADLMSLDRGKAYASKEAAWALLSRVYLYMEHHEKVVEYADLVINSGKYSLTEAANFGNYFANTLNEPETIWAIAMTPSDNRGKFGSIASMLYSDGNSGWGEEYASKTYRDLLGEHSEDVRWSVIEPLLDSNGDIALKNGIEIFYIKKFSFQDGDPNLCSPNMLRLAEVYLNRAEAQAKLGHDLDALADVDAIRSKRGLEGALYGGIVPSGSTALDIVLKERRLELAFEGHRVFDVFRNKKELVREYWGYHIPGLTETAIDPANPPVGMTNTRVNWDNPRIIYFIPIDEVLANTLCSQNQ